MLQLIEYDRTMFAPYSLLSSRLVVVTYYEYYLFRIVMPVERESEAVVKFVVSSISTTHSSLNYPYYNMH